MHGAGRRLRQGRPRGGGRPARTAVRRREPDQRPDRDTDLAHDLSDDVEDRLRVDPRRRTTASRSRRDSLRELDRQALLHGLARMDLLRASVPAPHRPGSRRRVPRGRDHPGGSALHGDGLRLVPPRRRRSRLHPGPGLGQRPDHARGLCADRPVPGLRRRRTRGALRGSTRLRPGLRGGPPRAGLGEPGLAAPPQGRAMVRRAPPSRSSTRHGRGAPRDPGGHLRVPGREHHDPRASCGPDRSPDSDPGLLQRRASPTA